MTTSGSVVVTVILLGFFGLLGWIVWLDDKRDRRLRKQVPLWSSRTTITFGDKPLTPERIAEIRKVLAEHEKRQAEATRRAR